MIATTLLMMIAAFFMILALALLLPVHLSLKLCRLDSRFQYRYCLSWSWLSLVSSRSCGGASVAEEGDEKYSRRADESVGTGDDAEKKGPRAGGERALSRPGRKDKASKYSRLSSLFEAAPALAGTLKSLLQSIHIREISGRVRFGLDDPAETAILGGHLFFVAAALGHHLSSVSIEPCFDGEHLDGELSIGIEARPVWAVLALFRALGKREIRRLLLQGAGWA